MDNPLKSLVEYSSFIAEIVSRPAVRSSTVFAPELSFRKPNLPAVIQEMEELVKQKKA